MDDDSVGSVGRYGYVCGAADDGKSGVSVGMINRKWCRARKYSACDSIACDGDC